METLSRFIQFRGTKLDISGGTAGVEEASLAYATDTHELGVFTGGGWVWFPLAPTVTFNDAEGDPTIVNSTSAADGTSTYPARRDHRHQLGAHTHNVSDIIGNITASSALVDDAGNFLSDDADNPLNE